MGDRKTIHTTGIGSIEKAPSQAEVTVGVLRDGESQSDIVSQLEDISDDLRDSLRHFDIVESVYTERYDVSENRRSEEDESKFSGHHVHSVTVTDIDHLGDIVKAVSSRGASVNGITLQLSDDEHENCRDEAIESAVENARHEAEVAAGADDMEVTGIYEMEVERTRTHTSNMNVMALSASSSDGPSIDGRDIEVTATVSVEYNISEGPL